MAQTVNPPVSAAPDRSGVTAPDPTSLPTDQATAVTPSGALTVTVVTAQKRGEDIQRVPVAISALGASQMAAAGISARS